MLKKQWILVSLALVLLVTAAGPAYGREFAVLKVDNRSEQTAYLTLTGPGFYYFTTPAGAMTVWEPARGEYDYSLYACGGHRLVGTLDLNKNQTFVVPTCGDRAFTEPVGKPIDVGRELKLVRVTFTGEAYGTMVLILYGTSTYVFSLPKDVDKEYTIPKGSYDYTLYGCGTAGYGTIWVDNGKHFTFDCPD